MMKSFVFAKKIAWWLMKIGDLVIMPGESQYLENDEMSVGLIVESPMAGNPMRIGVMWNGETTIDWEPIKWLKVIEKVG